MKINLSPQRRDDALAISRFSSVLTVNGEVFDFSQMADGDTLPADAINSEWFVGDVHKADGELELTLILPLPINYSPEQAFPVPLVFTADGPVALPQPLPTPEPLPIPEPETELVHVLKVTNNTTGAEYTIPMTPAEGSPNE